MDAVEQALLQALEAKPEDWSVRLLLAEKMCERGGEDEASKLIAEAPEPPKYDTDLEKAATFGGEGAIGICEAYVAKDATSGLAHWLLANLLESKGETERSLKHFTVARALGSVAALESPPAEPALPLVFIESSKSERPPLDELPQPRPRQLPSKTSAAAGPVEKATGAPEVFLDPELAARAAGAPPPPRPPSNELKTPSGAAESDFRGSRSKPPLGKTATSALIAIAVHVLIGLLAAFLVIFQAGRDEPEIVAAVIGPPSQKVEMQKKNVVKQTKKTSSAAAAAAPIAQLMRSNAVAKFSLPDVKKTSTGPLGMGEAALGSGGLGMSGAGLGAGASFFGGSATGNRFLFVIDHSGSMKPNQVKLRNDELERTLKALSGVQYQVLLFAGGGYYAQDGWSVAGNGQQFNVVKDPRGKTYKFVSKGGYSDYEFDGSDSGLPRAEWLPANASNAEKTMTFVRAQKLFGGTDWEMALRVGHYMSPAPDVIFFMADGTGGNSPPPILAMNKKRGAPQINTVAMQTAAGAAQFAAVAKGTRGKFTIVDKAGKPIDGFAYLADPGKFKGRL